MIAHRISQVNTFYAHMTYLFSLDVCVCNPTFCIDFYLQLSEVFNRLRMPYKEIQFFGGVNQSEREANSVAAHVLIDDEKMVNLIMEGNSAQAIAAELYVPEDLLLIAIEDYHKLHPDFIVRLPRSGRGNYLKDYNIWE